MDASLLALALALALCALLAILAWRLAVEAKLRNLLRQRDLHCLQLENDNARLTQQAEAHEHALTEAEHRLSLQFENLANRIFSTQSQQHSQLSQQHLNAILTPFKENLADFRKRVDAIHSSETAQAASLLNEVRSLAKLSSQVSNDAANLANAIKGNTKVQGDWGEFLVERILQATGLRKDHEYSAQPAFSLPDGQRLRPDFVVHLPDKKAIVIDSKVSLTAFERFANAATPAERDAALSDHLRSVRAHITNLESKDYPRLPNAHALDFVILCIPIEAAFHAAIQADPQLLYATAERRVVLAGPTNLTVILKLIANLWKHTHADQNAQQIASAAAAMYDQAQRLFSSLLDARKRLDDASTALDTALNRAASGKGNLVRRLEQLKALGLKPKRPPAFTPNPSDPSDPSDTPNPSSPTD